MKHRGMGIIVAVAWAVTSCDVPTSGQCLTEQDCASGAECVEGLCVGASRPVAVLTAPEEVALGELVIFDASDSARPDGSNDGLAYEWKILSPEGASFDGASDASSVRMSASTPHGVYQVQLVVNDRGAFSEPVVHEFRVRNSLPAAYLAAAPEVWGRHTEVTLDASNSVDPDGDELTFEWTLVSPVDSDVRLVPGEGGLATLVTGARAEKYEIRVVVSDGYGGSDRASIEQTLGNTPPQILASAPAHVEHQCDEVTDSCVARFLLEANVTDADGEIDTDSVEWSLKSTPPWHDLGINSWISFQKVSVVENTHTFNATLTVKPRARIIAGDYVFEVKATDSDGDTAKEQVTVAVGNRSPTISFEGYENGIPALATTSFVNGNFVATLSATVEVADEDNDQLMIEFLKLETESGVSVNGPTVSPESPTIAVYTISVAMEHRHAFIDGETPVFELKAKVTDVNGGEGFSSWPVVLWNPPASIDGRLFDDDDELRSNRHSYGALAGRGVGYFHEFDVSGLEIKNPSGAPLNVIWNVSEGPANVRLDVEGDSELTPRTLVLFSTRKDIIDASIKVNLRIEDVFGVVTERAKIFSMGNQLPIVQNMPSGEVVGHVYGIPSGGAPGLKGYYQTRSLSSFNVVDPDGDPVEIISWEASTAGLGNNKINKIINGPNNKPTSITLFSTDRAIVDEDITLKVTYTDGVVSKPVVAESVLKMTNRPPEIIANSYIIGGETASDEEVVEVFSCGGKQDDFCASYTETGTCRQECALRLGTNCYSWRAMTTNVVWGGILSGVGPSTETAPSLTQRIQVRDPDGDPVSISFSVPFVWMIGYQQYNRFQGPNGFSSTVKVDCVTNESTGIATCETTNGFGFIPENMPGEQFIYAERDVVDVITAVPHDGFKSGASVSGKVRRTYRSSSPCMPIIRL